MGIRMLAKNKGLVEKHICFGPVCDSTYKGSIKRWTIYMYVKQLDGTKTTVELEDHRNTAIFQLKEKVHSALSILPHQQKLTIGTTVLEDWDEDGKVLLLCNYPSIHDGVTIELVHVTEGIHVKLADVDEEKALETAKLFQMAEDLSSRLHQYS